ncbi:mitogen-activated protein kinase kinase kinase 5 isoform X1 [Senna tora]|uniref:mitogen-activated protein kinase kinase kinase n=1 Tax=Senna tora TaxID=362788 RepID=A0A834TXZ0_9FABA|nr:mitogen-activated protein kinase kinase kinase 5 isoform X1 [Senna tora]
MRWLPSLSFSTAPTLKASSSASSFPVSDVDHHKKKSSDATRATSGGVWPFTAARKFSRPRKLRPNLNDNDGKSPPRWHDSSEDDTIMPLAHSPNSHDRPFHRSNTSSSSSSVAPQPLPLPDSAFLRHKDGDCPLPSPKDVPGPSTADAVTDGDHPVFRIRSVFASKDARKNKEQAETRSSRMTCQDRSGSQSNRDNFWINVSTRSAPTSPMGSPLVSPNNNGRNSDCVQYHYVPPNPNQFWSAPEMASTDAFPGTTAPAFFDLTALPTDTSPLHSPPGKSPHRRLKSSSEASSPIHRSSLEISPARRDFNAPPLTVHPLPLPPGAPVLSPSKVSPTVPKSESSSMKSQWQKGKLIGRGTFGSVYVATNRETGALCAMKEVEIFPDDPKSAECIKQLEQEISVLSQLKHTNIVQYYGSEIVEDRFYIYLEYVHPGSINKYVREHCGAMTESVVRNFTRHILSGLAYLHSKKTIHRDIKGANLLVDSAGVVKLADFGMAKHLTGHVADLSLKGSPYWMAPELMQAVMQKDNSSDLAFAVDIWSLGCTIIEMLTGKPPWSEYEGAAAMFKVMRDTPSIPETLSSEGKDFLRCCFKRNPAERSTASALLEHRFLKNAHQLDVSSSMQPYNGTNLMEKPHSPGGQSEYISDQLSIATALTAKGRAAESCELCLAFCSVFMHVFSSLQIGRKFRNLTFYLTVVSRCFLWLWQQKEWYFQITALGEVPFPEFLIDAHLPLKVQELLRPRHPFIWCKSDGFFLDFLNCCDFLTSDLANNLACALDEGTTLLSGTTILLLESCFSASLSPGMQASFPWKQKVVDLLVRIFLQPLFLKHDFSKASDSTSTALRLEPFQFITRLLQNMIDLVARGFCLKLVFSSGFNGLVDNLKLRFQLWDDIGI